MQILTLIIAALQAATKYFDLKSQYAVFEILDKYDSRIDKLESQRVKLRATADKESQKAATKILDEILEEKQKRQIFLDSLEKKG